MIELALDNSGQSIKPKHTERVFGLFEKRSTNRAAPASASEAHASSDHVKPLDITSFHKLIQDLQLDWAAWNTKRIKSHSSTLVRPGSIISCSIQPFWCGCQPDSGVLK